MLGTSDHMSESRACPECPVPTCRCPLVGFGWLCQLLCMCAYTWEYGYFKARGVKKDFIPDMNKIELTNIPVKSGIVYPDVDCLLYCPG